jgi:hypothetical protein
MPVSVGLLITERPLRARSEHALLVCRENFKYYGPDTWSPLVLPQVRWSLDLVSPSRSFGWDLLGLDPNGYHPLKSYLLSILPTACEAQTHFRLYSTTSVSYEATYG